MKQGTLTSSLFHIVYLLLYTQFQKIHKKLKIRYHQNADVAQWQEATDLGSVQYEFESLHQHQLNYHINSSNKLIIIVRYIII